MSPLEWEEYLRRKRQMELLKQYAAEPTPLGELSPPEQTTVGETPERRLERLRKPLPGLETAGWEGAGLESVVAPAEPMLGVLERAGERGTAKLLRGFVAEPIALAQRAGKAVGLLDEAPTPEEHQGWVNKVKQYAEGTATDLEQAAEKSRRERKFTNEWTEAGENILEGLLAAPADVLPIMAAGKAKVGMGAYMALKAYAQGKSIPEALAEGGMGYLLGKGLRAGGELTGEYGPKVLRQLPETLKALVPPAAGAYLFGAPTAVEMAAAGKGLKEMALPVAEQAAVGAALSPGRGLRPFEEYTLPRYMVEAQRKVGVPDQVIEQQGKIPEDMKTSGPSPAEVEAAKYGEPTATRPLEPGPPTETVTKPPEAPKPAEAPYDYNVMPERTHVEKIPDGQGGYDLIVRAGKNVQPTTLREGESSAPDGTIISTATVKPAADGGYTIEGISTDSRYQRQGFGTNLLETASKMYKGQRRTATTPLSPEGEGLLWKQINEGRGHLVNRAELEADSRRWAAHDRMINLTRERPGAKFISGGVNEPATAAPESPGPRGGNRPEAGGGVGARILQPPVESGAPSPRLPERGTPAGELRGQTPAPVTDQTQLAPGDRVTYPNQITGKTEGGVVNAAGTLITLDGGGVRPIAAAIAGGARRVAPPAAPGAPRTIAPRPEGYTAPVTTEAPPEAPRPAPVVSPPVETTRPQIPPRRQPKPAAGPTETLLRELWDSGVKMPRRGESMWEELAGPRGKGGAIPPMMRRTGKGVRGQNYDMWLRRAVELGVLPEGADVSDLVKIARSPISEARRIDAQLRGERPDLTAKEQVEFDQAMAEEAAARWTERFPEMGGKIVGSATGIEIQLKNGNKILVQENVPEISVEPEAETKYREIHPEVAETTRLRAHGKTMRIGPNALIQIAKNAADGTDVHEVTHVAYDMGVVTRAEDSVLGNKYARGVADAITRQEAIADGIAKEKTPTFLRRFTARVLSLGEMLQNAAAKVGLAKEAVPSERRVVTDLRTGRMLRRDAKTLEEMRGKYQIRPADETAERDARTRLAGLLGGGGAVSENQRLLSFALDTHIKRWHDAYDQMAIANNRSPENMRLIEEAGNVLRFFGHDVPPLEDVRLWTSAFRNLSKYSGYIGVENLSLYSLKPEEERGAEFKLTPEEERKAAETLGEAEGGAEAREKYRRRGAMAFTEPTTTAVRAGAEKTAEAVVAPEAPRGGKPPEEFINFDRITSEADVQKALQAMADAHPEDMKAARGYRSQDRAASDARIFTQSDIDRIVKEDGQVSDRVWWQARQAAVAGGRAVAEAARALEKARVDGRGIDEAEKEYLKVYNKSLGLVLTSVRAGSEAGRALAMGNRIAEGMSKEDAMFQFLLKKQAPPKLVAELAKLDLSDPEIAAKVIRAANKPRIADMIQEYILSAMMSGPATHIRNFVSNSAMQVSKFPEKVISGAIDAAMSGITGTERQRYAGEVRVEAKSIAKELWQTMRLTGNAAKAAADVWQERGDINWGKIEATHVPALPGKVGKFVRGPLRAAGASDAWFGTIAAQQEISARVYRLAKNDVRSGKANDVQVRMQEILSNLDSHPDILKAAKKARDYWTFRDELGPRSKKILGLLNDMGIMRLAIAPFFKTPVKIFGRFIERSPIGLMRTLAKMVKKQYLTRGETEDDLARGLMGTAMAGAIYGFAQMGNVTGAGPKDQKEKTNKMATGWQPYSIKVGDTYYSYQGMEPLSSLLMATANAHEVVNTKDHDKWVAEIFSAAKDVAIDKTSLQGFQRISLAVGDPERWAKQFAQGLAGMPIPAVVARGAAALDQTARRKDTFWDVVRSRIPGMTGELEPRRTITGKEITREQTPLETFVSPFQRTTEKPAPLEREFDRIGYVPTYAPRKVVINKKDHELTREQMQFYVEADKKAAAEALKTIGRPYYKNAPEEPIPGMKTKQEILSEIWRRNRALARMQVVRMVMRGR
jgi:hypothetical protein